jgi:hypothetical protein
MEEKAPAAGFEPASPEGRQLPRRHNLSYFLAFLLKLLFQRSLFETGAMPGYATPAF